MAEKRSTFQIIIFGVFVFFIIIAVFVFAGLSGDDGGRDIGVVKMWGSFVID